MSCNEIDDNIYEMVGIYIGNVVGGTGPFDLSISADGGDNISIEAPFDGEYWSVIRADVDNEDAYIKDIDILRQGLGGDVEIWGDGFYTDGTIQLDYHMRFGNQQFYYRIVASR